MFLFICRKYNKLKKRLLITDSILITSFIKEYDCFKRDVVVAQSISLVELVYKYFTICDNLINGYFYPKIGVEEDVKKGDTEE